ncbi:MAG: tautomerase family protein [Actinomycetota bacterium]|nr:tautomerase family protein [Actinomycetota bacterium]
MPLVRIDIIGPKPPEYRRALLAGARDAVVSALGVPSQRVTVRLLETPAEDVYLHECRTEFFTHVEVLLYEGRTPEQKTGLVAALRDHFAKDPGIKPCEVAVGFCDASTVDLDVLPGEATVRPSIH